MIDLARLRSLLIYDLETGIFYRRDRPDLAIGRPHPKGYLTIAVGGNSYLAHRLAWFYVLGRWPSKQIDHRNMNKTDNRFANLREATPAQQVMNSCLRKDNKSGVRGVYKDRRSGKWSISIYRAGRRICWDKFDSFDEAVAARRAAERRYYDADFMYSGAVWSEVSQSMP